MSQFSNALQRAIDAHETVRGYQTAFARRAGVEPASLSRYLSAETRPDVDALERICLALDDQERALVVVAYLRDDIPHSAESLVRVVSLIDSPRIKEEAEAPAYSRLPKKARAAFDLLMEESLRHEVVMEAMISNANMMRWRAP